MKTRLIILANSYREGQRCIAGVDVQTGAWIRPVSSLDKMTITFGMRNLDGKEPELLDVIEIPLEDHGPDVGCQPENRLLKPGHWTKVGALTAQQAMGYCENDDIILHDQNDCIDIAYFGTIARSKWKSLQLIHSTNVTFHSTLWYNKKRWRSLFQHGNNKHLDLGLTDPKIIERLDADEKIGKDCLLTISLAGPWAPSGSQQKLCYKLVAGVIEL